MPSKPASIRAQTYNEVLDYLAFRIAVCRAGLAQYSASHGPGSRAAATERSALLEAELIKRELGSLGLLQRRSREFKKLAAEREAYRAAQAAAGDALERTFGGEERP
ncbi:hypothetical protein [Methylobacterium planeticum]|uniref:Uncharacterized protein n=1 Tax=Methylobacterium planeticum TaxID=2615211 RepID=A0A6N6MF00_9HYPH|nr:hypothetical protein [Methylobacterium planeticum]KAB1068864.1 hypothetical protein F6X51_26025 [Methylobacterium planeticum]